MIKIPRFEMSWENLTKKFSSHKRGHHMNGWFLIRNYFFKNLIPIKNEIFHLIREGNRVIVVQSNKADQSKYFPLNQTDPIYPKHSFIAQELSKQGHLHLPFEFREQNQNHFKCVAHFVEFPFTNENKKNSHVAQFRSSTDTIRSRRACVCESSICLPNYQQINK